MKKITVLTGILISVLSANSQTATTTTISGALNVSDSLVVKNNISTSGDISALGEIRAAAAVTAEQNLTVNGNLNVSGLTVLKNGFTFDGVRGLIVNPGTATQGLQYNLGTIIRYALPPCMRPNTDPSLVISGGYRSVMRNGLIDASISMYSTSWSGDGHIEVEGLNQNGATANTLFLNYWCGRNTAINTGTNGGIVYMGKRVAMESNAQIGYNPNAIDMNTSLNLFLYNNGNKGLKFNTYNNSLELISVANPNIANSPFSVFADGRTYIGPGRPKTTGASANALLSVDGLILAKEIRVQISNTHWADFVFEKNYKLMPLNEVEDYIKANKHLPEVPTTAQVKEDGIDVVDMSATLLKKVEELTIYIIEQNKKIEALEAKINQKNK